MKVLENGLGRESIEFLAFSTGKLLAANESPDHVFLAIIELCLHRRIHQEAGFRHADTLDVLTGAEKGNLEVARVRTEEWLIKPVIKHVIAHTSDAAPAFLNSVKVGQALG